MPRPNPCRTERWGRTTLLAGLLMAVLLTLWAGCSPARSYKTLSFFFDGVPDPNAPMKLSGSQEEPGAAAGGRPPPVVFHKPYKDGQCVSCHQGADRVGTEFASVAPDVCMQCHKDVPREYPVMHAPVAARACLWCHEPHDSPNRNLLRQVSADLCLQCHERALLLTDVKQHADAKASCLDCHLGHGSSKPGMLRPDISRQAILNPSTTQPAQGVK